MATLAPIIVIVLLGLVVLIVGRPLRAGYQEEAEDAVGNQIADLLAAKEAKYREIRDLELDLRTGKLTREDFRTQDRGRRAEAVEILRALDALGYEEPGAPVPARTVAPEAASEVEPASVARSEGASAPRPARVPST